MQVIKQRLGKKHICDYNKAVHDAKNTSKRGLEYQALIVKTLHLRVYTYASFASNDDMSSQLVYLVLLCDSGNFHVLDFAGRKSKRVAESIMGGELYAFTDSFDASVTLATDLSRVLGKNVSVRMFTDSKQVFDVITHAKRRLKSDWRSTPQPGERRITASRLTESDSCSENTIPPTH